MSEKGNKKNAGFDLIDFTVENIGLNATVMTGTGVVGIIGDKLPSSSSAKIMSGMDVVAVTPVFHAAGGLFGSFEDMNKKMKKSFDKL